MEVYSDRFPLLSVRKQIAKAIIGIRMMCYKIIMAPLFDNISIFVILVNSFIMIIDDGNSEN